jgi:hypothetical protein
VVGCQKLWVKHVAITGMYGVLVDIVSLSHCQKEKAKVNPWQLRL